jgi:hypothetical protein
MNHSLQVHGQLLLLDQTSGEFTYTPQKDWSGELSFRFSANDGIAIVSSEVQIVVEAEPDTPILVAPPARGDEDTWIRLDVTARSDDSDDSEICTLVVTGMHEGSSFRHVEKFGPRAGHVQELQMRNERLVFPCEDLIDRRLEYRPPPNSEGDVQLQVAVLVTEKTNRRSHQVQEPCNLIS